MAGEAPTITPSNWRKARRLRNSPGSEKCRRYCQTFCQAAGSQACQESLATQCGRVTPVDCRPFPPKDQSVSRGSCQRDGPRCAAAIPGCHKAPDTRLAAPQAATNCRREIPRGLLFISKFLV